MDLKEYHGGFKPTNPLEWRTPTAFHEIHANANLIVQLKENLEAP